MRKFVLTAIKPQYAQHIEQGTKTIEVRKIAPKVNPEAVLVIYESAPISKLTSYTTIKYILEMPPKKLLELVAAKTMIDEKAYYEYFSNKKIAYGIALDGIKILDTEKELSDISKKYALHNYYYIKNDEFELLTGKKLLVLYFTNNLLWFLEAKGRYSDTVAGNEKVLYLQLTCNSNCRNVAFSMVFGLRYCSRYLQKRFYLQRGLLK